MEKIFLETERLYLREIACSDFDDLKDMLQDTEVMYALKKQYWHKGYAAECARALAEYAFNELNLDKVIFEIRPENMPSRRVAEKLGAKIEGEFIKRVKDKDMRHLIYGLSNGFCV